LKKLDFVIIIVAVLVACALFFFWIFKFGDSGSYAVVYLNGEEKNRYALSENINDLIQSENGVNEIQILDGSVSIISADCADKICVNHVPIYRNNESIICLPHKMVVEIQNDDKKYIDAVTN